MTPENLSYTTVHAYYEVDINMALQISTFYYCAKCLTECPPDITPRDWARTQTGFTASGNIQVWCNRHNVNVVLLTFRSAWKEPEGIPYMASMTLVDELASIVKASLDRDFSSIADQELAEKAVEQLKSMAMELVRIKWSPSVGP